MYVCHHRCTELTEAENCRATADSVCPALTCAIARRRRCSSCSGVPAGLMPHTLSHDPRQSSILCARLNNVTERPTAHWTAQQIVNAFPDDSAPSYLLHDRDQVYGQAFRQRVQGMRIREVLTAAHSPWQNPFTERLIGSVRRECLDHVLVLSERHLRRVLTRDFAYYHGARTHRSLEKDAPDARPIERPAMGKVVPIPEVGGLHHRDVRRAA